MGLAHEVAGDGHHFGMIQLPYNLAMTEAFSSFNQTVAGEALTLLEAAERLGVAVVASASLLQAQLTDGLPEEVEAAFDLPTDAQRAIQFVRSTPGVATALVGMSRTAHVRSNLQLLGAPPAPAGAVLALFADE